MFEQKISILIYHRVLDKFDMYNPHEVDIHRFNQQMKWVKRFFNVLPLDEAIKRIKTKSLPTRALSITFDDGYRDNYANAWPILEQHGLVATFFVATGFLNGGIMWNDDIIEAFRNTKKTSLDLTQYGLEHYVLDDKKRVLNEVIEQIKFLDSEQREFAVENIKNQLEVKSPTNLMMTHEQVSQLARAGMGVGGHTIRHPILTKLGIDKARNEIIEGKSQLEYIIGKKINTFAYPNGKPGRDYIKEHVGLVRDAGFEIAVSTATGIVTSDSDMLQLPRFTPWDKEITKFMLRLYKNRLSSKEQSV